jgi:hypothetical protein
VSTVIWFVGNELGGQGSLLATLGGLVLAQLAFWGFWMSVDGNDETYARDSAILLFIGISGLFAPVAGYELSSHYRRQRQNYSVGLSPIVAAGPSSAARRVEGATLAIRGSF